MMKKIINKKADMSMPLFVTLVVLILSFLVLLYFLFAVDFGGKTDKDVCHNSIVIRDKTVGWVGSVDCRTDYICVSGGGDCSDINSPSSKIKVDASNKDEIMKTIADEMASCWWQFGEGQKPRYGPDLANDRVHYAICSIMEFDGKVQEKYPQISYSEFYEYLERTPMDNSQSYLSYLYGVSSMNLLKTEDQIKVNLQTDVISTKDKYSIITGLDRHIFWLTTRDDIQLKVYIIPTSETNSRLVEGSQFMTKA